MSSEATRRFIRMFHILSTAIDAQKDHLSDLDGAVGDADHGITMSLGFAAVNSRLSRLDAEQTSAGEIFDVAASAFLDAVGASTGPLYATGFRGVAKTLRPEGGTDVDVQAAIIEAITAGIKHRGKGQRGDKTMLDAWMPAAETAAKCREQQLSTVEFWTNVIAAAEEGRDATRSMVAAKGRAARLGERSLGHVDPGAASAVIILKAMRDAFVS